MGLELSTRCNKLGNLFLHQLGRLAHCKLASAHFLYVF